MKKPTLDELGVKYKTDKSKLLHGYLSHYEKYFGNPETVQKFVEIGLQRGKEWRFEDLLLPSMRVWHDYFDKAFFYGFDIKELKPISDRMYLHVGDQGNLQDLIDFSNEVGDGIDILLDDGSHKPTHQLATFAVFWPKISRGGVYVIEDCNALVQKEYPRDCRIHKLIKPFLVDKEHYWIPSKSAGEKSSLVIIK